VKQTFLKLNDEQLHNATFLAICGQLVLKKLQW